MTRPFLRFVLVLTALLGLGYAYLAARLTAEPVARLALLLPFVFIWIVPVRYWGRRREAHGRLDDLLHVAGYLAMGWLNFAVILSLLRDVLLLVAGALPGLSDLHRVLAEQGAAAVLGLSVLAVIVGAVTALRPPRVREVEVPVEGLSPALHGLRIVQISDLHVGTIIRRRFVERVVEIANGLQADVVALTGDLIDGPVSRLAGHVAPLGQLQARQGRFLVLGNHEYYAGAAPWVEHFRGLGLRVLLNEHHTVGEGRERLLIGGVTDPAAAAAGRGAAAPRPDLAAAPQTTAALRVLLAHHPKLAPAAEAAGFDLQLSGHTHGGQFFPWNLVVRHVHAPHAIGLSRRGRMWVYVSPGTGSWGPPLRLGTSPEITLLRVVAA